MLYSHKGGILSSNAFTLYVDSQYSSPYAMSVFVALTEKGQTFDLKKLDLSSQENRSEAYAKVLPTRRVPTLVHGDFQLGESSAIAEYLDELLPAPGHQRLYPADLRARATARQVQAWLRSDLMPIRQERSTATVFVKPATEPLSDAARKASSALFEAVERLLPVGSANLFGDWSVADTDLAMMLMRLVASGDPIPQRLADYARAQWQRPSVQQWVRLASGK